MVAIVVPAACAVTDDRCKMTDDFTCTTFFEMAKVVKYF